MSQAGKTRVEIEPDWDALNDFLEALIKHCGGDEKCFDRYMERFLMGEEVELNGRVYRFYRYSSP